MAKNLSNRIFPSRTEGSKRTFCRSVPRLNGKYPVQNKCQIIKEAIDPLAFYAAELPNMPPPRRNHGWVSGGCNPLRDDQHPGSFRVNLSNGAFVDFAADRIRGHDIISWTMLRYGLSFPEAISKIAADWGVTG